MKRAMLWGTAVALLVFAAAIVVGVGVLNPPSADQQLERVLIIGSVPATDGGEVAPIGFVLDRQGGVKDLDMLSETSVSGVTANTARDAYPFGGGSAVVRALEPQLAGESPQWVVIPADELTALIDAQGGVRIDMPAGMSVYREGTLTVLPRGRTQLDGGEVVALLSALDYVESVQARKAVIAATSAAVSSAILSTQGTLAQLVADGAVTSSVVAERLPW